MTVERRRTISGASDHTAHNMKLVLLSAILCANAGPNRESSPTQATDPARMPGTEAKSLIDDMKLS
jgi:hypothetical protein